MRTTLNLDDDVFATAKALANQQRKPVGVVVSSLLRTALNPTAKVDSKRNGMPLFPIAKNARQVTPQIISQLLEDEVR